MNFMADKLSKRNVRYLGPVASHFSIQKSSTLTRICTSARGLPTVPGSSILPTHYTRWSIVWPLTMPGGSSSLQCSTHDSNEVSNDTDRGLSFVSVFIFHTFFSAQRDHYQSACSVLCVWIPQPSHGLPLL